MVWWYINHYRLFNAQSSLYTYIDNSHNLTWVICLHTVCSIWSIARTLSSATTLGQSGPGSNGNKEVLHIPQISKAGVSPSDKLSYPGHSWGGGACLSAEMESVYSTAPADWALPEWVRVDLEVMAKEGHSILQRHSWCNRYHYRKWTWWPELRSWSRLFCIPCSTNTLRKGKNSTILPPVRGK